MKLFTHSHTSTAAQLKFGNRYAISPQSMQFIIHFRLKLLHLSKRGLSCESFAKLDKYVFNIEDDTKWP